MKQRWRALLKGEGLKSGIVNNKLETRKQELITLILE
jgi:hypothetical protein